ncbi:hypothetical protein [Streptomyces sp. NPDC060194]|uniref:hypothetical protein n=1 Tax=Streptomyces sp. NPDC060194 TaxID=3347069 RepID=UPI00366A2828
MSGPLRLVQGEGDALPEPPRARVPRPRGEEAARTRPAWAEDPLDELAERLVEQVSSAVHPYEVAALLESDGLTGEQITARYGRPDLFTLAEDLHALVPRHYPEPPPPPDPWKADHVRCALRGLVFALPGLAYVVGAGLWQGRAALTGLVAAALFAWAWNQGLSHRAHVRLAAEGGAGAGRTLALGAPAGALAATAVATTLTGWGGGAAFAAGQSCYLAAASVLLVLGRERALLGTLLPLALGAAATLLGPLPTALAVALLLGTLALACGVAAHAVRRALSTGTVAGAVRPRLAGSVPYGLFGLAAGVLAATAGALSPRSVIVLTLSMGAAEWLLYRYRSLALRALRAATEPRRFTARAAGALACCLACYLALLAAGSLLAGTAPAPLLGLGALLWLALLLQAFSLAWLPAAVCLLTAAAVAAAPLAGMPPGPAQLLCWLAAAVLAGAACHLLGRPTAHR